MNKLGAKIKTARLEKGLTQKELASIIGVPYRTIQRWEKGDFKPNMANFIKLTNILDISFKDLSQED